MIANLYQHYLKCRKINTDTRQIDHGSIFFALKGPKFNANEFASEALAKGASFAVIDDARYREDERYILVDNVLKTLQELARHHRDQLNIPVIGLTGSNGKTTTKELINAVLSRKYNVLATKGNLNNHIGVPLTVLSILEDDHDMAIVEMGANHVGEIQQLCEIANPTHGLITNIGKAHLEGFGGYEGVIRAKSELYHHLIRTSGVVWINSQNEVLNNMAKRFANPLFYPAKGDYYHCEFLKASPFVEVEAENGEHITTQLIGKYNFENIAVALCIGKFFNVPEDEANQAVAEYTPQNNRSQIIRKGSNMVILDAYNANPSSMALAIENLAQMEARHKIVILGDMKELGPESASEHEKLGAELSGKHLTDIYLCGELIQPAEKHLSRAHYFPTKVELIEALKTVKFKDAVILVKASRSLGLEDVVEYIR
ncbi:UDP-N-acetylmuramoylalanyl-D-glutamyl-2,6-diaminopimelate--D-alanyl-D-alanine ligase [Fulvivirga imtechensis AK7]|uniref:UDP-N-acetylmuramoyl-tripeptide--D-alanyl-D-alanine ligase n=1 Tax=Fulvivirga imtechensis AK7 TaxID=1237149 RepID=L8JTQ4_9BACT|nr:UDP-N-acetylmuramoyl-tripeptide--D-alanyl-D-alanine ligase [Fulvivirga imtechensis]ELR72180.1 UDP-N-acetylmuramoylalanyl-D-glutamyl-2,6-diaminopimelate--D-alanyl-D-alanine ligase [Fulvivirga imtechensis AK7]